MAACGCRRRAPPCQANASRARTMKIVTYDIQLGLGKDGRNDLARIAREVDGADIIALQEVERNW